MHRTVRRQLPNGLTILRLVLAGAFFAALNAYRYPQENVVWAQISVWLFVAAATTDALDGYLARRWDVTSTFGRIMDPFCDKVLVLGAFIYLAGPRFVVPQWVTDGSFFTMATGIYPWMVVVILARELLVTGVRAVAESRGVEFGAKWSGKAKMVLQSICVPVVIFMVLNFDPVEHLWSRWICYVLVYLTVVITLWSGLPYVMGLRAIINERPSDGDDA